MLKEGFKEFVHKVWDVQIVGNNIERWQKKLRLFRQKVRVWKLDEIDKRAEVLGGLEPMGR